MRLGAKQKQKKNIMGKAKKMSQKSQVIESKGLTYLKSYILFVDVFGYYSQEE